MLAMGGVILSSCEGPKRADYTTPKASTTTTTTSPTQNRPVATVAEAAKQSNKTKKETKTEKLMPVDRKALEAHTDSKIYTPEEFQQGIIKGEWIIEEVGGIPAVGETTPFLRFDQKKGKIYGNNGCNTVNADYECNPKASELKFNNTLVTMMLCNKQGITDLQINNALNETRSYSLQDTEDGYKMTFFNSKGKEVMRLYHQNLDFLNGTWRVASIDGNEINVEKMKLVFDIDERKVHGNTGCNVLNGRLETDMDVPNTFSFEGMSVTMMTCPEIEYQQAMLIALEEACKAKPINKDEVMLLNSDGDNVMTLVRTEDK